MSKITVAASEEVLSRLLRVTFSATAKLVYIMEPVASQHDKVMFKRTKKGRTNPEVRCRQPVAQKAFTWIMIATQLNNEDVVSFCPRVTST